MKKISPFKFKFSWPKRTDQDELSFTPNIERDWKATLLSAFFFLVLIFLCHYLFYLWLNGVITNPALPADSLSAQSVLNHAAYEDALSDIKAKQDNYKQYSEQKPSLIDPSL